MSQATLRRPAPDFSDGELPAAATSSNEGRGARPVWGAFALLMTLASMPLVSTILPPLVDYPNHLARMHLLSEGGNAFYAVRWAPLPNLAQDLIVPSLAGLMPLDAASKLFLIMTFGLIASATIWLNRIVTGVWSAWPLLTFLVLYNRTFLWGFLNYLFGIGVALGSIALWLALERERTWFRVLTSSLAAMACYFSHIAAFGFYALVILGVEAPPGWTEWRTRQRSAFGRRIVVVGAQFVIPTALYLGYWPNAKGGAIGYGGFWRKADLLFSVFDNYNRVFDIPCFALFLGLLGWLAWTRRLRPIPRLGWAAIIVFIAYLLLPSQIYGGYGADHRLPVAFFLLLIAACAPRFPNRRTAAAIGSVAAILFVVRLAVIEYVWREADSIYSTDLAGIDALPRNAKLAVAIPAGAIHVGPVPTVHLAAWAVPRREAFVPTLFAIPGQQPIALNPPYATLADAAPPSRFWAALVAGDRVEMVRSLPVLQQYDFVAVTGGEPVHVPPNQCFKEFFQTPTFQILQIVHDQGCTGPNG